MPITTSIPFNPTSKYSETTKTPLLEQVDQPEEISAINRFKEILNEFINLIQKNRREISQITDETSKQYERKTDEIADLKNAQGFTGLELALAGATLTALSLCLPYLDSSPDLKKIFDSVGGADAIKKILESGSGLTDKIKPITDAWSESRLMPEITAKEFLNLGREKGEQGGRDGRELVKELNHIADEVRDNFSETRYR